MNSSLRVATGTNVDCSLARQTQDINGFKTGSLSNLPGCPEILQQKTARPIPHRPFGIIDQSIATPGSTQKSQKSTDKWRSRGEQIPAESRKLSRDRSGSRRARIDGAVVRIYARERLMISGTPALFKRRATARREGSCHPDSLPSRRDSFTRIANVRVINPSAPASVIRT